MGGKLQKDETTFIGEVDPSRHHVVFNLEIGGGLGWMKRLKNWAGKSLLYFMQLFLHYIHIGENFIG